MEFPVYGSLDIATSGMLVQKTRLDVASANLANADAILDSTGRVNPYRTRRAIFAPGAPNSANPTARAFGVHVAKITIDAAPAQAGEYNPDHPYAYQDGPLKGYVARTNVNTTSETINAMTAVRAYEANVMAAEATKQMFTASLRLIA